VETVKSCAPTLSSAPVNTPKLILSLVDSILVTAPLTLTPMFTPVTVKVKDGGTLAVTVTPSLMCTMAVKFSTGLPLALVLL